MGQHWRAWEPAWQEALYAPGGFYTRPAGASAHFATAIHGLPHSGAVMARALAALAARHGLHTVVDLGAGRGDLLTALGAQAPHLHRIGVDIRTRPPGLDPTVPWLVSPGGAALPEPLDRLRDTLVVANEWLDVVPAAVACRDRSGVWRERLVRFDGEQAIGGPVRAREEQWLREWVGPQVRVAEVGLTRDRAWADLCRRVEHGVVLAIDYGHRRDQRPVDGTLTGYRRGRQVAPVPDGSMDLTAHVAVDALLAATPWSSGSSVRPGSPRTSSARQQQALADLLGPEGLPCVSQARAQPTAYLRDLAEHSARCALQAPGGLGDFWWVMAERTG